jgi:hypothetical protein
MFKVEKRNEIADHCGSHQIPFDLRLPEDLEDHPE